MQVHASCAARNGDGVLLLGPPGSGKSDMVLRLLDHGFMLVADDRVEIEDGCARPANGLAGLLEVRGLGICRLPYQGSARLRLVVSLGPTADRVPEPGRHPTWDVPHLTVDPARFSAARIVALALECAMGRITQLAGAFA
jgi:HPr kinase/phosphorylase